jgi:transposase
MNSVSPRKQAPRPLNTVAASEPGLISLAQAAKRFGIATRTAYDWARAGEMPGLVRVNGRLWVKRLVLERFLAGE